MRELACTRCRGLTKSRELFREKKNGGMEGERREIGRFTLEGSPCNFCKFLSYLIPWRDSGTYRLGTTFLDEIESLW